MSGLAAFYLELLRNAHVAAVEDGAVLTGGQTLGLGSRIDDNMLFNPQTGFNDIPAAYTIPTESREVNALADAELVNLGLTRVQLVDLLVNQFDVRPSHLAYAWDIPTYAVMHEGRRQSEELPEFYTGNPLEPLEGSMQHSAYRPNNRWTHRQGKDVSGDTRPFFDEATGMQHQVPKHPDAQGPIYEHTNPFIANSATGWAIEAAFGAVFGPTGIRIMRTGGGKAFDLLAANLDLPEPLRNQFRNIANWLRPDTKLTVLPGGGQGGPGGGGPRGVVPDPDPPMGRTGGGPYDVAGETGPPPGVAGGAEFPIPPDRTPDLELPDADVIPFPTDRFGPADDVPLVDTLDQLSGAERFRAFQAEGRARAREWWDTLSDEGKATAQKAWERHGETGQVFDPTNDYDIRNAYVIHKRGNLTPAEQWNALGDPRPQATDALYEGMTLEDIGELQGVAASEVTPAHIAEAVDAGVLSEADGARLLDPIPRTPEVPGQQSLFEEIEAMRPGTPDLEGPPGTPEGRFGRGEGETWEEFLGEGGQVGVASMKVVRVGQFDVTVRVQDAPMGWERFDPSLDLSPKGDIKIDWVVGDAVEASKLAPGEVRESLRLLGELAESIRSEGFNVWASPATSMHDRLYQRFGMRPMDPRPAGSGRPLVLPGKVEGPPGTPAIDYGAVPIGHPDHPRRHLRRDDDLIDRYPEGYMAEDFIMNEPKVFDPETSAIERKFRAGEFTRDEADALLEGLERIRTFPNAPGRQAALEGPPGTPASGRAHHEEGWPAAGGPRSVENDPGWVSDFHPDYDDSWMTLADIAEIREVPPLGVTDEMLADAVDIGMIEQANADGLQAELRERKRIVLEGLEGPPGTPTSDELVPEEVVWGEEGLDEWVPEEGSEQWLMDKMEAEGASEIEMEEAAKQWAIDDAAAFKALQPPSGGPFAGDPRMNPTLETREGVRISRNLIMHNSGGELGVGGTLRPMVIVDLGDGRLQPFYRRSGTGNRGAEADLIAGGGGGGEGNWVPFDGIGTNAAPGWFRKDHYTGHGLDTPLFRYGTEELKAVGETLDRSPAIQAMLNDPQRQIPVQSVTADNLLAGTENYISSEGMNQLLGTHTPEDWAKVPAGPMRQASSTDWEFYLPPVGRMTDDELRAGLQWKIDGPPSTSKMTGGKVAAETIAGPVALLAAEAAFPTQVKQVMTGLADRADSWWSWIKDYPDHLEWMTRSVGSTLDGLEKGSRSTGNQTVDLLSDGFRDQSNALLTSLGGGAVPVIGREDADLVRGTSKHLSQQGHNGQAMFSNDVRRQMEAGDAMVVGYRSEQDYQRALEQAGRYGLEIDRHFWRKPNRKNIRPARGQEWTRDDLKKLATANHFYPDAGLRQGPR